MGTVEDNCSTLSGRPLEQPLVVATVTLTNRSHGTSPSISLRDLDSIDAPNLSFHEDAIGSPAALRGFESMGL